LTVWIDLLALSNKVIHRAEGAKKRILRPPEMRGANRAAVLQLLRHNEHMSRADIARQTGLSEGTISRIMSELISDSLVREDGEENSTGGRPGRRLQLEPKRVAFGAEIQNWETRVAVSTMRGQIVESRRFRTPPTCEEMLDQIAESFAECGGRLGGQRVAGMGVCARGIVNSDTGTLVLGSRAGWSNICIREELEARIHEPVYVENNVRAAALAEYYYGSPEVYGARCFVFVKVDEGVGTGILLEGKLYPGPRMAAGEFGQMVIAMSAGQERHDRPGCLERLASNPALCDRYAELCGERRPATSGDTSARVKRIVQRAIDGEQAARESLRDVARYLGVGISNVIWGLDADVIVIDGAITDAWPLIEPLLRDHFPESESTAGLGVLLRPSALGGEAALVGAATLPFTSLFATGESHYAGATA
jgi:predicted NBD/HSP70 family sugar kinase